MCLLIRSFAKRLNQTDQNYLYNVSLTNRKCSMDITDKLDIKLGVFFYGIPEKCKCEMVNYVIQG